MFFNPTIYLKAEYSIFFQDFIRCSHMVWYGVSVVKCVLVDEGFFLNRRRLMEQGTMDVECL